MQLQAQCSVRFNSATFNATQTTQQRYKQHQRSSLALPPVRHPTLKRCVRVRACAAAGQATKFSGQTCPVLGRRVPGTSDKCPGALVPGQIPNPNGKPPALIGHGVKISLLVKNNLAPLRAPTSSPIRESANPQPAMATRNELLSPLAQRSYRHAVSCI